MASERTALLRKVYTYSDGETGRSVKPGATKLTFQFLAPEKDADDNVVVLETRDIDIAEFIASNAEMAFCATAHGLSQKLGDDLAGIAKKAAKDEVDPDKDRGYVDYATQRFDDMLDDILNGVWVAESEGTGAAKTTMLFTAICNVLTAAGREFDEADIRTKLKDEEYRKNAKSNPQVASELRELERIRAEERAKKAAEKAAESGESGLDDLV